MYSEIFDIIDYMKQVAMKNDTTEKRKSIRNFKNDKKKVRVGWLFKDYFSEFRAKCLCLSKFIFKAMVLGAKTLRGAYVIKVEPSQIKLMSS